MRDQNVFAGACVDRAGERRKDERWLESAFDDATSIFLPVHDDRCLIDGSACEFLATLSLDSVFIAQSISVIWICFW